MARVGFETGKYKYFNTEGQVLFSSDDSHNYLFEYVTKDLSVLPKLFNQYISSKINIDTFTFKNPQNNTDYIIDEIKNVLASIHPYYKHECDKIVLNEIGKYYNTLLVYKCYNLHNLDPDLPNDREWYYKNLMTLMPATSINDIFNPINYKEPNSYINQLRLEYEKKIGVEISNNELIEKHENDDIETVIFNCNQIPAGFSNELQTHTIICNMLYYILDILAPDLEELTLQQRTWLYDKIFFFSNDHTELAVKQYLAFHSSCKTDIEENHKMYNLYDIFQPLFDLQNLNVVHNEIPVCKKDSLHSAIEYTKTITSAKDIYEEYEINSLHELLHLEILSMIQTGTMIRKCKNCGRYFIVTNRKTAYCDRIDNSGMYCSAVGAKKNFQKKMEKEEALKIYNRAYKTHHARVRNKNMSPDEFSLWCTTAKNKLEEVRNGYLDINEFEKWLKI